MKVNSFFCGAGGMDLGLIGAGMEIIGAWDFDAYAVESYDHNISTNVTQENIKNMKAADLPNSDLWTFGFPCQDISNAGKQAGMIKGVTRSGLFYEVMRLIDESVDKPKFILAENVKNVKKLLPVIEKEYNSRGYKMTYVMYNAKYFDLAQSRERYFILGIHESVGKDFVFPAQVTDSIPKLSSILETNVDEKYYMSDDKIQSLLEVVDGKLRIKEATSKGFAEAVEGDSINITHPNSKTRRGRVGKQVAQTLMTGQGQLVVEPKLTVVGTLDMKGMDVIKRVYDKEGLSPTLTTSEGGHRQPKILDGFRVRKLTPREYARLQGFPDSYEQVVSNTQFYKQMGNAVPVNVAKAIGIAMIQQLEG